MSFQTPITIASALEKIDQNQYLLPAIQREFEWEHTRIEWLFDSIMRGYPISSFLFWDVKEDTAKNYKFYKFINSYREVYKTHNEEFSTNGIQSFQAILDGQQRLTSLYIGLKGSYAYKLSNYNWKSDHAFPKRHLYVNLLNHSEDIDLLYDFRFLSDEELNKFKELHSDKYHWFKVGQILDFTDFPDIFKYIAEHSLMDTSKFCTEQTKFASDTLSKLFQYFNQKDLINFYLEKSDELDKVLHIFIRVNSGGTKLSYSDLLLSIATAQWRDKDAREIIHKFVDQINAIDPGFNINKDLVLKSCLVLTDIKDIKFKVDNFSAENMALIEAEWDNIARALNLSIQLIASFGFNDKTLTAYNAIIPIAYFIKKNNFSDEILHSASHLENRKLIKEWLVRALLKKVFGGTPDNLYPTYRSIISENLGQFPLQQLIDKYNGTNKSLSFDEATIEHLLNTQYGSAFAYMVLSLLYPLNHNYKFHQDHIHPKKFFTHKELIKLGVSDEHIREQYLNSYNAIANLQLIQETENLEKNATPFFEWLHKNYKEEELINYKNLHFIPKENNLSMDDYLTFYAERKEILKSKLMLLLKVDTKTILVEDETELIEEELA